MLGRGIARCWQFLKQEVLALALDRAGGTAVMLGVSIIPIGGLVGMAIDVTRGYMLRAQLSHALDAAGLAGGKQLFADDMDQIVQRFFDANFPDGYMGAIITGPTATSDAFGTTLTLTAEAQVDTTFMRLLGHQNMTVSASTVIERSIRGMELVLVMDITGSMRSGGKIDAMKDAGKDLLGILYAGRETVDDFWVGIVPYTTAVNIGPTRTGWLSGYDPANFDPTTWKGCTEARGGTLDRDDTPPATAPFVPYNWPSDTDNDWPPVSETNQSWAAGPNKTCGNEILPLNESYSAAWNRIDELTYWRGGGTMGNVGLAWGWRLLSPQWRGLWGGATPVDMPFDYGKPLMDKVVVILTDGYNQFCCSGTSAPGGSHYTAFGRLDWGRVGTTNWNDSRTELNNRLEEICTAMKAQGIILYTITFQVPDQTTKDVYGRCASGPTYAFDSPSNAELQTVFRKIGDELSNLRIKG